MAAYKLTGTKTFMGQDTYGVNTNLRRNGKKIATYVNDGSGGPSFIDWVSTDEQQFTAEITPFMIELWEQEWEIEKDSGIYNDWDNFLNSRMNFDEGIWMWFIEHLLELEADTDEIKRSKPSMNQNVWKIITYGPSPIQRGKTYHFNAPKNMAEEEVRAQLEDMSEMKSGIASLRVLSENKELVIN